MRLLLLAGVGQEAFQLLYKRRLLVYDDTRDLLTDLIGLLAAFAMAWVWQRLWQSDELREQAARRRRIEPVDDAGRAAD